MSVPDSAYDNTVYQSRTWDSVEEEGKATSGLISSPSPLSGCTIDLHTAHTLVSDLFISLLDAQIPIYDVFNVCTIWFFKFFGGGPGLKFGGLGANFGGSVETCRRGTTLCPPR